MYLTVKTDLTAPRPKEISRNRPPFLRRRILRSARFDGPERGSSGETSAEKIRRHMNWIGEEPF